MPAFVKFVNGKLYGGGRALSTDLGTTDVLQSGTSVAASTGAPLAATSSIKASPVLILVGMDDAGKMWARDATNGNLSQSDDWGANWTNLKGLPATTTQTDLNKIISFGGFYWTVMKDTGTNLYGVYRAPAVAAGGVYVWSAQLFSFDVATNIHVNTRSVFNAGSAYLYIGTYTSPGTDDSRIWRLSLADAQGAGTNWVKTYDTRAGVHHIHAIKEDPYNPGHIYATFGDNSSPVCVARSTDYGATWADLNTDMLFQSVQISFSPKWVWLASDRNGGSVHVLDRATGRAYVAAKNWHYNIAIPGAATVTDRFYSIGYWGACDPAQETYYMVANDTSASGNKQGIFWLPAVGERIELIEASPTNGIGDLFIGNGYAWSGNRKWPLISTARIAT